MEAVATARQVFGRARCACRDGAHAQSDDGQRPSKFAAELGLVMMTMKMSKRTTKPVESWIPISIQRMIKVDQLRPCLEYFLAPRCHHLGEPTHAESKTPSAADPTARSGDDW